VQLQLSGNELDLLANILLAQEGEVLACARTQQGVPTQRRSGPDLQSYERLLEKVLARNMEFDSDELEQIADILTDQRNNLKQSISAEVGQAVRSQLQQNLERLESVLERIEEVCAML